MLQLSSLELIGCRGEAVLSGDATLLLVNNITTGAFDLYHFSNETPSKSFDTRSTRRKITQCTFAEDMDKVVIGGSDHGKVYIFDVDTTDQLQVLEQEKGAEITRSCSG